MNTEETNKLKDVVDITELLVDQQKQARTTLLNELIEEVENLPHKNDGYKELLLSRNEVVKWLKSKLNK